MIDTTAQLRERFAVRPWADLSDFPGASDLHERIPKNVIDNSKWRRKLLLKAAGSQKIRERELARCAEDLLYFVNAYCWTYDVLRSEDPNVPFVTYDFQERALLGIESRIGKQGVVLEKSRDMGGSWLCLLPLFGSFVFKTDHPLMIVSRKSELVDLHPKFSPDTLFWKLDYLWRNLPGWMRPPIERSKMHMFNPEGRNVFDGASTTGDIARGGRRIAIMIDEFGAFDKTQAFMARSAIQMATNSPIYNSTPGVMNDEFKRVCDNLAFHKIQLRWQEWPEKAAGRYRSKGGTIEILDPTYRFPPNYRFMYDGLERSPYFDLEDEKLQSLSQLARELNLDHVAGRSTVFDLALLARLTEEYCNPPIRIGELSLSPDRPGTPQAWLDNESGHFRLWIDLHEGAAGQCARPVVGEREFVVGVDISPGSGASESCFCITDRKTGQQVGEYANSRIRPSDFAVLTVGACRLFAGRASVDPLLIWENNTGGIGEFGKVVQELGYGPIYRPEPSGRSLAVPGFNTSRKTKRELLEAFMLALKDGRFMPRSARMLRQCAGFVHVASGAIEHSKSIMEQDPSGSGVNHGDRGIAAALTNWIIHREITIADRNQPNAETNRAMVSERESLMYDDGWGPSPSEDW